jgi:hypothetical protein
MNLIFYQFIDGFLNGWMLMAFHFRLYLSKTGKQGKFSEN